MARSRTPTAILEAKGSFLRNPKRKMARKNEPKPNGEGEPPNSLTAAQKRAWRYLAGLLAPGVAKSMDRAAFEEMACLRVLCKTGTAKVAEPSSCLQL